MNKLIKNQNKLIDNINVLLIDYNDFQNAFENDNGDIIIKRKLNKRKSNDMSILTNIFKEIINNDVKKNRV